MLHYIDLRVRPDPEFPEHQILAALYGKLHRALALIQTHRIGVVFPGYVISPPSLGNVVRVFGPAEELDRLVATGWLQGLTDHVSKTALAPVPATAKACELRRVQAKSSPARLRRRQMRRHGLSAEQAQERIPDTAAEMLKLPFLEMSSASTGQRFRLFLRMAVFDASPQAVQYNAYGLASEGTVPWF